MGANRTHVRVAIVDSSDGARDALTTSLAAIPGCVVAGAFGTVEDAARAIELDPPDVIVFGASGGSETSAALRDCAHRFPALPLLVLAETMSEPEVFAAIRAGAIGYLLRDTAPPRLLDAIRELRDGGAPLAPAVARAVVREFRRIGERAPSETRLSPREAATLRLLGDGNSYKTAAASLGVSVDTVRFHVRNIYAKLHVHSKVEAVVRATREGLLS